VILNKTDLVAAADLARIEQKIRGINGTAKVHRAVNAGVPIDVVLGLGAFDLDRALAFDSRFLEPQYPFEWAGAYKLVAGRNILRAAGPHAGGHGHDEAAHDHGHDADASNGHDHGHGHDHGALKIALLPLQSATQDALAAQVEPAVRVFAEKARTLESDDHLAPAGTPFALEMQCMGGQWCIDIEQPGPYALFVEHAPAEFGLALPVPASAELAFASHHHDAEISSIGIEEPRALDARKVNDWLSWLLQAHGENILRMKGVLN